MRGQIGLALAVIVLAAGPARAVELDQIISRENPSFHCDSARLVVGRDGKVYVCSGGSNSFVLRLARDGTDKFGGAVEYAAQNATANADGLIATANGHFAHKVTVYGLDFARRAEANEFLVNDQVGWDAPIHVEAGAGGDFYAIDQHRDRILKISPAGKLLKAYTVARKPEGNQGMMQDFRVCEKTQAFVVLRRGGPLACIGFDGTEKWTFAAGVSWGTPNGGGFDLDDEGNLFTIDRFGDVVQKVSPEGKPLGKIKLEAGKLKPGPGEHGWSDLRVHAGDLLLRRRHATELFQRYDLATGVLRQATSIDHERLAVSFPDRVWIAGADVPFKVKLTGAKGDVAPRWRVWARPLGSLDYREFTVEGGRLKVPTDCAGIYQVKLTPELQPWQRGVPPAYGVRTWVDIRAKDARGSATVWTESLRDSFGRGETIRCLVQLRGKEVPAAMFVTLRLLDGDRAIAESKLQITATDKPLAFTIPTALTAALKPGRYTLTVAAPALTCVPQTLVIGPGLKSSFHLIQYGDYGPVYPSADVWGSPDAAAAHVARIKKIGVNMVVDRLGSPLEIGALEPDGKSRAELQDVLKHLEADKNAPAPGRYAILPALKRTLSAYSADGVDQMAILMMNDAGLPLGGPGFDHRKPPQLLDAITKVTEGLKPFPAFRGWSWSSNWWVFEQRGSKAATSPEEKLAYETALKRAKEAAAWDPVLERVSSRRFSFAVDAQEMFNKRLRELAPNLFTASACPHRNVESYPPVTLRNVDEVDLQAQWEQIAVPYHAPHGVDFYRRPGKRAWAHPEIWNDSGTGDQILPTLFQAVMRGADGVGCSGQLPPWAKNGSLPHDPRAGHYGTVSVYRALYDTLRQYGPWLNTLASNDRVAIVVSGRMLRIDDWPNVMGTHFARLFEAYCACLHAHHPASYVFVEDLKPDTLKKFQAVLVVGQTVEMEPELAKALAEAQKAGVEVFHDDTCRPGLVRQFTPLGLAFNQFEKDRHPASDDDAYLRFAVYCKAHVERLRLALDKPAARVAGLDDPEVFASERKSEEGRYLFVVNNATPELEPGHLWRITLAVANRVPSLATVKLTGRPGAVYDVFAGKRVEPKNDTVEADLRALPARVFAILPKPIAGVELKAPAAARAGRSFVWGIKVLDEAGQAIAASVPVRLRLRDATGTLLDERLLASGSKGTGGALTIPLTATGELTLEATELFSGTSSNLRVEVRQATLPVDLTAYTSLAGDEPAGAGKPGRAAWPPAESRFGPHVRDVTLTNGGSLAVLNTMNWDHNLYALDTNTGEVKWRQRAGQYFAFEPLPLAKGIAVQGFDFESAEGYHLYLIGADGQPERRFALYALPTRQIQRFVPGILTQHINHFAVPADGKWIATAGDLGLAVWARDGKLLWSREWWKTDRHTAVLAAVGSEALLALEGMTATAFEATTGKELWKLPLARSGEVRRIAVSAEGKTVAVLSTADGGRVFVLRDGKVLAALPTGGNEVAISPDGARVVVVEANHLKLYTALGGLLWTLPGDDTMLNPRFAPDGNRIACGSALGTAYVVGTDGTVLLERDMEALTVPAWLPGGDLLLTTWMGVACRLDRKYAEKWRVRLQPTETDMRGKILAKNAVPTTRIGSWGNADPHAGQLPANLLTPQTTYIRFVSAMSHVQFAHPAAALVDGKPDAPATPWLHWGDVGNFAELSPINSILIDTFRTQLRVTAITLIEDPEHPESWLRDATFEYWDVAGEKWVKVQQLLSNGPVHTHTFARPVEAARFRLVLPRGVCGNLRLGEIALHGEKLGSTHPDVIAKKPVAVLFDEGDDLKAALVGSHRFRLDGAYSGGRCLALDKEGDSYPPFLPPFGHALPNWDFEIAEKPAPGQYRYLQFAWKATSPDTKGIALQVNETRYGVAVGAYCGEYKVPDGVKPKKIGDAVPQEWQVVRIDLWEVLKQPARVQALRLTTRGGGATFDQIVLGRAEEDLPKPEKPAGK
jgi:outer membrane protein assembly factor BamB